MTERFDPCYTWLGIPPEQQPPNHYRLLGIEVFESNLEVIESAADQRMTHLRSFQTGKRGHLTQKLLNEVAAAKICLLDANTKARYDATLRERLAAQQAEAVEADMFSPSGQTAPAAFSVSTTRKAKPKPNVAMIGAFAAAGVAVVLLAVWLLRPGGKPPPNEPRTLASAKRAEEQRSGDPIEKQQPKDESRKPQPPEATPPLPESPAKKAEEPGRPKGDAPPAAPPKTTPQAPEPAKKPVAPQPPPTPPQPPSAKPGAKPSEEAKQRPVPSAEIQREVGDNIEAVFKVAEAQTPEAKIKLAKQLAEEANKTTKPDEQYVLLRKAAELASDGGDAGLMLEMAGALGDAFAVDPLEAKDAMLKQFIKGPRNAARLKSLADGSAGVIDDAMAEDRYDMASDLADLVLKACARSPQLRKEAGDRRKRLQQLQKQFHDFEKASDALKSNRDDAEAHLAVGAWYCLIKNDWQTGVPHLANGSDAGLKALAQRDLSSPRASPEDQARLADAWWDAAADRRGDENAALLRRAGHW